MAIPRNRGGELARAGEQGQEGKEVRLKETGVRLTGGEEELLSLVTQGQRGRQCPSRVRSNEFKERGYRDRGDED